MSNTIEKMIDLRAPIERVWAALTDSAQFGEWFRVRLEAPFVPGEVARGQILHPGYEHLTWQARIVAMDKPALFSFTWHPYGVDKDRDYSSEKPTLVEFRLTLIETGTRLVLTESGFDDIPASRRAEAFRMNESGWAQQVLNIQAYVESSGVFAALGDPTRLSLLARLSDGRALSIAGLSSDTHLTRQAVTKHLQVLEGAGLVASTRVGRESRYAFRPEAVVQARSWLDEVSAQWDDALERLRTFVED